MIIKLHRRTYEWVSGNQGKPIGWEEILFNSNEIILVEKSKKEYTCVDYKRAMLSSFICRETLDQIYNLINKTP